KLIKNIAPGATSSNPVQLTAVGSNLFFVANNGVSGNELWKSNGTAAGTILVRDINPGSPISYPRYLTNVNGALFFAATNGKNGGELWTSNGSGAATV